MIDEERLLELNRFFDGELPEPARSILARGLAYDAEAIHHLDALHRLRRLANRHDPASGVTTLGPWRRRRGVSWRKAAVAAAVVALIGWPKSPGHPDRPPQPVGDVEVATAERPESPGPSPEVALHRWSNSEARRPEPAARALWQSSRRARRPGLEVLALEMANAPPGAADRLQRDALSRRPGPYPRPRSERPDSRPHDHPAHGPEAERRS